MIHPSSFVGPNVILEPGVEVGPLCVIEGDVRIGADTKIGSHTVIHGITQIGARCKIGPGAFVGTDPQDRKYAGAPTRLIVGDDTIIRENVTLHRSTSTDPAKATRVGARCFIMACAHVGHDCVVGDDVVMANSVALGGHVTVGQGAFLGGNTAIHQFVRIGRLAIVGGVEGMAKDIPPFAAARFNALKGYNAIGCRRSGMTPPAIHTLRRAFRTLLTNRSARRAADILEAEGDLTPEVTELIQFIRATKRGMLPSMKFRFVEQSAGEEG